MEDTLRDEKKPSIEELMCLNPCFNGRYSQSNFNIRINSKTQCLNPCFNGRYSQREGKRVDYAGINES